MYVCNVYIYIHMSCRSSGSALKFSAPKYLDVFELFFFWNILFVFLIFCSYTYVLAIPPGNTRIY